MNLNKPCAQCRTVVYPLEQIKCLDQVWHRRCFRCHTCGMALTMSNYRGYEKKPYCSAHYPQPKRFTVVSDTPELQRIAQNSRVMSNDFYRTQGQAAQVAYSPNGFIIYGKQAKLQRAHKISVVDDCLISHHLRLSKRYREATYNQRLGQSTGALQPRFSPYAYNSDGIHYYGNGTHKSSGNGGEGVQEKRPVSCTDPPRQTMYTCTSYIPSTGSRLRNDGPKVHSTEDVCSTDEDLNILPQAQSTSTHERFTVDLNHHFEDSRKSAPPASSQSQTYRAIYDYEAREDDEVTFIEGDIILNGDPITEGWMFGTVQRTGQFGMLPSNYVELLK